MSEPIPDEELENIARRLGWAGIAGSGVGKSYFQECYAEDVPRLVAEVEQLRADLRIANEATLVLMERAVKAEAEVERLRTLEP